MIKNFKVLIFLSLILFIFSFTIGIRLAKFDTLGNDEVHSQVQSIEPNSYLDIIQGNLPGEGNNAPLFYLTQKIICDVLNYKSPPSWSKGERFSRDPQSLVLLRLNPLFFTSLASVLIFMYFARFHSVIAGLYAFLVFFSSEHIWMNWAEARHYSLWIFLTTCQILLFLIFVKSEKFNRWAWRGFFVVHMLLSLTTIISVGQIFGVTLLLWIFKRNPILKHLHLIIIPALLSFFYYSKTAHIQLTLTYSYWEFITINISPEHLLVICLFIFYSLSCLVLERNPLGLMNKNHYLNSIQMKTSLSLTNFKKLLVRG